jgi:hypothetical protein
MTRDAVCRAPHLVLITLLVFVGAEAFGNALPANSPALRTLADVIRCILLVPVDFALYRLLLLAEPPGGYRFDFASIRVRRFLVWSLAFELLTAPALFLDTEADFGDAGLVVAGAGVAYVAALIYVVLRLALLLPALAAGRDNLSWRDAWADSRGRLWRLIKIVLGALLPVLAIAVLAKIAVGYIGLESDVADMSDWRLWGRSIFYGALAVVMQLPLLAAGAMSFNWIGDRVKQTA